MGNIGNKGSLVFSVLVDLVCHVVQGFGKIAHFVLGFHWNAITQISVGIFGSPLDDLLHWSMDPFLIAEKEQSAQGIHGKKNHLKNSKKTASFLIKLLHVIMVGNIAFCYTGIFHRYHHIKMGTGKIAIKITDLILGIKPGIQIRIGYGNCVCSRDFFRGCSILWDFICF